MPLPENQGRPGEKQKNRNHPIQEAHHVHYPFWFGGSASCFAATVRLQTRAPDGPKGMFGTFLHILKNDGFLGLYSGLSASLLRQLTYSTTRFGIYSELKSRLSSSDPAHPPGLGTLILLASTSGIIGGVAGNPADVLNVRMQNDRSLPSAQRRNYRNALHGLYQMTVHEPGGWKNGFRGVSANSVRAGLMTASQLASYDGFKRWLTQGGDGDADGKKGAVVQAGWDPDALSTHFAASLWAGFVATTVCSPVDVVKTRIMSASTGSDAGKRTARQGVLSLLGTIYKQEGLTWMFRGWVPSFVRLGPHTIATFLFLEQHKKLYRMWVGVEDEGAAN